MLLQTNNYFVPADKRPEHDRLMRRFRQALARMGCEDFEVYEQVEADFTPAAAGSRCVQLMRFRDRKHHQAVQDAERNDPAAKELIRAFCDLINIPWQQQQSLFSTSHYIPILDAASPAREEQSSADPASRAAPTSVQPEQAASQPDIPSDPAPSDRLPQSHGQSAATPGNSHPHPDSR